MKRYTRCAVAALLVFVPWHETVRAEPPSYTVQNLGRFGSLLPVVAGVNNAGVVVANTDAGVVIYSGGAWQAVPGLADHVAAGINSRGDIAGTHGSQAFRYRDGVATDIPLLDGFSSMQGLGINDQSDVVGLAASPTSIVPFLAPLSDAPVVLPGLGFIISTACGINATRQVAGYAYTPSFVQHGTRLDEGAAAPAEIMSPSGPDFMVTTCAIDAAGRVGGQAALATGQNHAIVFTGGTSPVDVDTFNGKNSKIESIAAGLSVGWYEKTDGSVLAFANTELDNSFDLNTRIDAPGWVLRQALAVNEGGVIAGQGRFGGVDTVFRLVPVAVTDTTPPVINSVIANPSFIDSPTGAMVPVSVVVDATDAPNAAPVCSLTGITGGSAGDSSFTPGTLDGSVRAVAGRTYTLAVSCSDAAGNSTPGSVNVSVAADTTAPVIASVTPSQSMVWPPNGKMVDLTVAVSATDNVDAAPQCSLVAVSGGGAGDAVVSGPFSFSVRAQKGSVYCLKVVCQDNAGNKSSATALVTISK